MKRDLELFRDMMLMIELTERRPIEGSPWQSLGVEGRSHSDVLYHARMLLEQGYLYEDACNFQAGDGDGVSVFKFRADAMTNAGHEFLESVRDPEVWRKTKNRAEKIGSFSIDLVSALAKGLIKKKVRDYTEVEIDL